MWLPIPEEDRPMWLPIPEAAQKSMDRKNISSLCALAHVQLIARWVSLFVCKSKSVFGFDTDLLSL